MPRTNWKSAPSHVKDNITRWRTNIPDLETAAGWVTKVFNAGHDLDKSEIPQSCTTALAALPPSEQGMFRAEHTTELASEAQALLLWSTKRYWAANTSIEDDPSHKRFALSQAADAERARITTERFLDGLVGSVRDFMSREWNRSGAQWLATHPRGADHTNEPAQPSFTDTVDAVLGKLGYVRADQASQGPKVRKAS